MPGDVSWRPTAAPADILALCREVRLLRGAAATQEARDLAAAQRAGLPFFGGDTSDVLALRALLSECRTALAAHDARPPGLLHRLDAALKGGNLHDSHS